MARRPLVPRMHLFEIDDQEWFPSWCRSRVQAALTIAWDTAIPILQSLTPAQHVARILKEELGSSVRDYVFIDFCAGGGGPTPSIERELNKRLSESGAGVGPQGVSSAQATRLSASKDTKHATYAEVAAPGPTESMNGDHGKDSYVNQAIRTDDPVQFVLTDLHPHVENWAKAAAKSPNMHYEPEPVDAANAPAGLVEKHKGKGGRTFRLFNLAFHHFDDPLARAILKNTVETSDGFAIFELQDRSFSAFLTCCIFGIGIMLLAPVYAIKWRSPMTLFFAWLVPVLPFVLIFDGWISSLRSRTPDEVEALLRTCGARGGEDALKRWEMRSGRVQFLWPVGYVHWITCVKQ